MSNHHTHESHSHNFINKHTAPAILLLIIGCFLAGYFLGQHSSAIKDGKPSYRDSGRMMSDSGYRPY
ncbi:MAG: hypothetical protein WC059_01300 [Candidatus Paceibacterota bacterium]